MIEKVHIRSDYNADLANDVAILKLAEDIKFSDRIKPVCLPDSKYRERDITRAKTRAA
jgi:hypothetical protein